MINSELKFDKIDKHYYKQTDHQYIKQIHTM